jgi:hypothetical protein
MGRRGGISCQLVFQPLRNLRAESLADDFEVFGARLFKRER